MKNNNHRPKNPLARHWFVLADDELDYAQAGFKDTTNWRLTCFHAQQVAEKYLKGYLQEKNKPFPKTHSLIELLGLAGEVEQGFFDFRSECATLDRYYIETRYPGDISPPPFTKHLAKEALQLAEEVRKFIFDHL